MSIFTPSTALYMDVLDYLDRRGIPSIAGIFDDYDQATNPYLTNENVKSVPENIVPVAPDPALRGPVQIEGPGDGPRGTGLFGNLEPGSKRTVLVDGVPTEVYKNITTGLLQTFDGKNVKGDVTETGAYDYEFEAFKGDGLNPINVGGISAFSRPSRVDVAVQQGAVDLAARLAEAEKKKKEEEKKKRLKELQDKIDAQGGNQGATFSGGKVTGNLGQGQSPHSSMSDSQGDNRNGPGGEIGGGGVGGGSMGPGGPGGPRRV
jgi:hypothetical protein|tara:strand:- start:287 stop:1072 length:786 start_codon:yes stop_codon:yes gene_type:complete